MSRKWVNLLFRANKHTDHICLWRVLIGQKICQPVLEIEKGHAEFKALHGLTLLLDISATWVFLNRAL